nr:hypothetical protein [Tanacetum cinerariifolium]
MSNDKESSAAGTDNRAPMLEENDYESWKIHMKSDSIANDVCAIVRTAEVRMPLDAEISSSCVRELSKGLELEAEIAKKNKMLSESEKRCSHIEKDYIDLEIKFQEYRDCFESPNPKVLTLGMFAISTKYILLPRRENWDAPTPKPRKKQVTFREPPRPSHSTTQKI